MKTLPSPSPVQLQQTKQQFAHPDDHLSYELGNAVKKLPPLYTRLLAGTISFLVLGTISWAALSKVDEVADASGQVIPSAQVQPLRAGVGGRILALAVDVTEGKHVQKGEPLVQLDPTLTQAEVHNLEQQDKLLRNDLLRLEAELIGKTQAGTSLQNQLLASHLKDFDARLKAAQAEVNRQLGVLREAQVKLSGLDLDLKYASVKEQHLRTLNRSGAVPRFDYFDAQNKVIDLEKAIATQEQQIHQAQQSYQAAKAQLESLRQQRQSEILTQIDQQHQTITVLEGKLSQAKGQQNLNTIPAPITGNIYNIQVTKGGGTVQPGQELLSIVPDGAELLLEVKLKHQDIGFVAPGMKAKVKLAPFPYQEFGTLDGTVVEVSPNAVTDKELGLVFITRIRLKQHSVRVRGQMVPLVSGTPVTADIITRQKSILSFLIEPITARWEQAFSVR